MLFLFGVDCNTTRGLLFDRPVTSSDLHMCVARALQLRANTNVEWGLKRLSGVSYQRP